MPLSGKEMRKRFESIGFEVVPGQGKGSHWKLRRKGLMIIVPNHKELKTGTEHGLLKQLKEAMLEK